MNGVFLKSITGLFFAVPASSTPSSPTTTYWFSGAAFSVEAVLLCIFGAVVTGVADVRSNPGGVAGTDWSWRCGSEPGRETEKLHGLPSIGAIFSLKSQGYCEYGPGEAATNLFVNDDGLFPVDCDVFA